MCTSSSGPCHDAYPTGLQCDTSPLRWWYRLPHELLGNRMRRAHWINNYKSKRVVLSVYLKEISVRLLCRVESSSSRGKNSPKVRYAGWTTSRKVKDCEPMILPIQRVCKTFDNCPSLYLIPVNSESKKIWSMWKLNCFLSNSAFSFFVKCNDESKIFSWF